MIYYNRWLPNRMAAQVHRSQSLSRKAKAWKSWYAALRMMVNLQNLKGTQAFRSTWCSSHSLKLDGIQSSLGNTGWRKLQSCG